MDWRRWDFIAGEEEEGDERVDKVAWGVGDTWRASSGALFHAGRRFCGGDGGSALLGKWDPLRSLVYPVGNGTGFSVVLFFGDFSPVVLFSPLEIWLERKKEARLSAGGRPRMGLSIV